MKLAVGTVLCGFTVTRVREVKELNAELIEMSHNKTGAALCWMNDKEENKLFSVAFKTIPNDSTGVFHILEHSVLCGSEKYPVKEPFVDLLKSSMNTFLNAMTYPDKTVYPVSSRNERDYLNLASVYLDAVFAPALTENRFIFWQEGIHTELNDGEPSYKGVVFNEMKGAMSGVNDRIEQSLNQLIFPDNCYRFNSGGEPSVIPDLTYEKYVDTYRKFYHPSNARFFLDGDIPLEETLSMINSYLEKYEKEDKEFDIPTQLPVSNEMSAYYEIDSEESAERKALFALGKIIGSWKDKDKITAIKVLCEVLAATNESPLKRAVLSSGLADDVEMNVMEDLSQPYLMILVRNMEDQNSGAVRELIKNTAEKLVKDGIDKKSIHASINRLSFNCKQLPEPKGLYNALDSYKSWLYGGDPLLYLVYDETIELLRKMADNGGFEELLSELLCDETGVSVLHMLPSYTLGEEERQTEADRLEREVSALSEDEMNELLQNNERLSAWQQTPDSPEASATLPTLPLSAVKDTPELIKTEEKTVNGVTVLHHPLNTHGIVYLSMYFPLTNFSLSELKELSFMPALFGELSTEKHTAAQLQQEIKTYIGSLNFGVDVFGKDGEATKCTPCITVHAGILRENLSVALPLIAEILTQTKLDAPEKIRELLMQSYEESRHMAIGNGHALGLQAVRAQYTAKGAVTEAINGYTFFKFLHRFAENFDEMIFDYISLITQAQAKAVCKAGLTLSVASSNEVSVEALLSELPEGKAMPKEAEYKTALPKKMGIRIPAQIAYAVKGYHLSECGMKNAGSLRVTSNIITFSYLWNEVRVQGGAYGTGFPVGRDGALACYSYRDPSPERSLEIYDAISDFIKAFCESDEELDKYIISAVAATEPLKAPAEQSYSADELWFAGVTDEDRIKTRREMLSTDKEALKEWCAAFEKMADEGAVCVVGPDAALNECDDLAVYEL